MANQCGLGRYYAFESNQGNTTVIIASLAANANILRVISSRRDIKATGTNMLRADSIFLIRRDVTSNLHQRSGENNQINICVCFFRNILRKFNCWIVFKISYFCNNILIEKWYSHLE